MRPFIRPALLAAMLIAAGCRKDDLKINDPGTESHLALRFRFMDGGAPFSLDSTYTDGFGTAVRITGVHFLLRGFTALQEQGFETGSWPGAWCVGDASDPDRTFPLGVVRAGSIHFLRASTGADSTLDRLAPWQCTEPSLLAPLWADTLGCGYSTLFLSGIVDTDGDGQAGPLDQPFSIRCTGADYHRSLLIHAHADVHLLQDAVIDVRVDVPRLLKDIDVPDSPVCNGQGPVTDQAFLNLTQGGLGEP